jgi:Domain of unknown function (DUF4265)
VERHHPHDHVLVSVEAGSSLTEELAVVALNDGTYRLLEAPAVTFGLARDDVFTVDEATLRPRVLTYAGNLTVWLYPEGATEEARSLADAVERIGGTLEGATSDDRLFIFTVPVAASFPSVEALFERFVAEHPDSQWCFGNVYAHDGVTPLEWWKS